MVKPNPTLSELQQRRTLAFTCDQKWEDMEPLACGRFCAQCQKPVIDFSGSRRMDVLRYLQQNPGTCGRFGPEQLDPSLIPIEDVAQGIRKGLLASLAAFAIHTAQAQVPAPTVPPSIEQNIHEPSVNDAVEGTCTRDPERVWTKEDGTKSWLDTRKNTRRSKRGASVFLSWRFPFIHVRRRTTGVMEIYRHGRYL